MHLEIKVKQFKTEMNWFESYAQCQNKVNIYDISYKKSPEQMSSSGLINKEMTFLLVH